MRNDVSVSCTVMSVDGDCSPEITAMIGASVALSISNIPWGGPVSGVFVGFVDGKIVINPTAEQRKKSELSLTVASTENLISMIEAGANEIPDEIMYEAILKAHEVNKEIVKFINDIKSQIGKPKFDYKSFAPSEEMVAAVEEYALEDLEEALYTSDKLKRDVKLSSVCKKVHEKFGFNNVDIYTFHSLGLKIIKY